MRESSVNIRKTIEVTLPRPVTATIIPAGHTVLLPEGETVKVAQALGSSATVTIASGELARLSPEDSIEFGLIKVKEPTVDTDGEFSIDAVWEAATTVFDPEIPVDIVELGLVYRIEAFTAPAGHVRVEIDMSVTAPFCGMGDIMRQDLHEAASAVPGVGEVEVKLVFDPPWSADRMSDVARLELGMM